MSSQNLNHQPLLGISFLKRCPLTLSILPVITMTQPGVTGLPALAMNVTKETPVVPRCAQKVGKRVLVYILDAL